MTRDRIVVGIDIGSSKIGIVAAKTPEISARKGLEILGFGEVPTPPGSIVNGSVENVRQVGQAIQRALDEIQRQVPNLTIEVVNISFGGSHTSVHKQTDALLRPTSSTSDEVTEDDVEYLVNTMYRAKTNSDRTIMHVLPVEFSVDGTASIYDPVGRTGLRLSGDFLLVSASNQSLQRTIKSVQLAKPGIEINQLLLSPIATGLAVLDADELSAGVALVDIGDQTTDLIIYHEGVIRHIASFPIGGQHITADLRIGCGVQANNAEALKRKFGTALAEGVPLSSEILVNYLPGRAPKPVLLKNVALIIEERLKEIAAMVYAEIQDSGCGELLIGGIVLSGGSATIPDIEQVFSRVCDDMQVRIGLPDQLEHTPKADAVSNTTFATALGLIWAETKQVDSRVKSICKPSADSLLDTANKAVYQNHTSNTTSDTEPSGSDREEQSSSSWWDILRGGGKNNKLGEY